MMAFLNMEFVENSSHLPINEHRKPMLLLQLELSISKLEFDEGKLPDPELLPTPLPLIPPEENPGLLPVVL